MVRPPPRERAPLPAKSSRKAKVAAPAVVSFKSMAKCMAEAMLRCQEFKRAKKPNGQGVKRVKLTPEEKARRNEERRMRSEERKQNKLAELLAKRAARVIANPGKYSKVKNDPAKFKNYYSKDAKAARKAKWDAGEQGRLDRKFMREQKAKLKEVQNAASG